MERNMKQRSSWTTIPAIRTFAHLREAMNGYTYARVILTALDLDIFSVIGRRSWTVQRLARTLGASERGIDILCRNLASLGLLDVEKAQYKNTQLGASALNRKHQEYRGEYLSLLQRHWDEWSHLTEVVRTGTPRNDDEPIDENKHRRSFTWAMHHRSRDMAPRIAKAIDLRGVKTLLDVGGGPGTYTLAMLARWPTLHGTVGDRPAALQVARTIARKHPEGKRLSYLPLDFMADDIPGRYDVIFLSNVIHIYGPDENIALLKKIRDALTPGGRVIIQDFFLWDSKGLRPVETNLFAVTMLLYTHTGNTYTARTVKQWMTKAGFRALTTIPTPEEPLIEGRRRS